MSNKSQNPIDGQALSSSILNLLNEAGAGAIPIKQLLDAASVFSVMTPENWLMIGANEQSIMNMSLDLTNAMSTFPESIRSEMKEAMRNHYAIGKILDGRAFRLSPSNKPADGKFPVSYLNVNFIVAGEAFNAVMIAEVPTGNINPLSQFEATRITAKINGKWNVATRGGNFADTNGNTVEFKYQWFNDSSLFLLWDAARGDYVAARGKADSYETVIQSPKLTDLTPRAIIHLMYAIWANYIITTDVCVSREGRLKAKVSSCIRSRFSADSKAVDPVTKAKLAGHRTSRPSISGKARVATKDNQTSDIFSFFANGTTTPLTVNDTVMDPKAYPSTDYVPSATSRITPSNVHLLFGLGDRKITRGMTIFAGTLVKSQSYVSIWFDMKKLIATMLEEYTGPGGVNIDLSGFDVDEFLGGGGTGSDAYTQALTKLQAAPAPQVQMQPQVQAFPTTQPETFQAPAVHAPVETFPPETQVQQQLPFLPQAPVQPQAQMPQAFQLPQAPVQPQFSQAPVQPQFSQAPVQTQPQMPQAFQLPQAPIQPQPQMPQAFQLPQAPIQQPQFQLPQAPIQQPQMPLAFPTAQLQGFPQQNGLDLAAMMASLAKQ